MGYGKGRAEIVNVMVKGKNHENFTVVTVYFPLSKSNWPKENHKEMFYDTLGSMERMTQSLKNIRVMGVI